MPQRLSTRVASAFLFRQECDVSGIPHSTLKKKYGLLKEMDIMIYVKKIVRKCISLKVV